MNKTAIIVLAAGESKRMKSIKQILKIESHTLLDRVLEKAYQINAKHTYCVLGAHAEIIQKKVKTKVQFILNRNYTLGLSESIKSAFTYFEKNALYFDSVLILLGDQPAIEIDYLNNMIRKQEEHPTKIIASNYKGNHGVPASFPKNYFNSLQLLQGDSGAKELMKAHKDELFTMQLSADLVDIDTPEDYQLYLQKIKAEHV